MMEKLQYLKTTFDRVEISETPKGLNLKGAEINRCTDNAKLILVNNPNKGIKYLEGFLMIFEREKFRAVAHAWNSLNGIHFDISSELMSEKHPNIKMIWSGYFPYKEVNLESIPSQIRNITPFTKEFEPVIKYMDKQYPVK